MTTGQHSEIDLEAANAELEGVSALERVAWAQRMFGSGLVMSTSFGIQSAVLLHLASRVNPRVPVVFIDTGYLFPETYRFAVELEQKLGLNVKKYQGLISPAEQEALYGRLWESGRVEDLEKYNFIRKVEPMDRALKELKATGWMAGLRRTQAQSRKDLPIVQRQNRIVKVHPIIDWSDRDIYNYLQEHGLPYHPLWDEGYVSVGDVHSTTRLADASSAEATRFNGLKRECGLHEVSGRTDFNI